MYSEDEELTGPEAPIKPEQSQFKDLPYWDTIFPIAA